MTSMVPDEDYSNGGQKREDTSGAFKKTWK